MELNVPNTDLPPLEVQQTQPVVYAVDATKCRSVEEMGVLLNALGLAMTKEYAEANGLQHLLVVEDGQQ